MPDPWIQFACGVIGAVAPYLNKLKVIIKILKRILICVLFNHIFIMLLWGDDILFGPFTVVSDSLSSLSFSVVR